MKERPILFNGAMVKAILDGRKTQTRRIIKPQPANDGGIPGTCCEVTDDDFVANFCRLGAVGSRLWVRETFYNDIPDAQDLEHVYYRADGTCCDQIPECQCASVGKPKWTPSLHMPRWASRITLEITDICVQRVQEVSEEDAKAEGALFGLYCRKTRVFYEPTDEVDVKNGSYRAGFEFLWDCVYNNWEKNLFVWAITFCKI